MIWYYYVITSIVILAYSISLIFILFIIIYLFVSRFIEISDVSVLISCSDMCIVLVVIMQENLRNLFLWVTEALQSEVWTNLPVQRVADTFPGHSTNQVAHLKK